MTPIRNLSELADTLVEPRAFLFLRVEWASQARLSRLVVDQVISAWASEHPGQPTACYIADVSDQAGEVWDGLATWLASQGCPAGIMMNSGVGPLLWLRSGHVIHHVLAPSQFGAAKLMAASRDAFADAA